MPELVTFTRQHLDAFATLSHDRNPLHCDPEYARRTPHGRVVLHGMAGVLTMLGAWARGRRIELLSIRGRFARPVFPDESPLTLSEAEESTVTLKLARGRAVRTELKFTWRTPSGAVEPSGPSTAPSAPLRASGGGIERLDYQVSGDASAFGLAMPRAQLNALAGASYLVGMVVPGRQALFSEFEIDFAPEPATGTFAFRGLETTFDPRFAQWRLEGTGTGIRKLVLTAFERPPPVEISAAEIHSGLQLSGQPFAGKTALVSGASRGFGAVVAQGLALAGARVLLHYSASRAEAEQLQARLDAQTTLVQADLTREEDCRRLAAEVGSLDLVVQNAFPPIEAEAFLDQSADEVLAFLHRSAALDVRFLHALLPQVKPEGLWLYVSSAFTRAPEPRFAHYAAAKSATEGLLRALSVELKGPRFAVARPPRMLTDQTNLPFHRTPPASPIAVARALLERALAVPAGQRFTELDL